MRLVDADKLIDWLYREPLYHDSRNDRTDIIEHIKEMPTVIFGVDVANNDEKTKR